MESEQSSQENPDNVNPEEQSASQVRSYDCTFCKRGFSNAQALGGHMNIHRRHKAKLKHPSPNEVPPSPDIPKILDPSFSPIPTSTTHLFMEPKSSQVASSNNWPWFLDKESDDASNTNKTHVGEIQQLSLFVDKPSSKDHHHQQQQFSSDQVHGSTGKGLSSSELDLELRLGPEPQDSSPATGTKRFF